MKKLKRKATPDVSALVRREVKASFYHPQELIDRMDKIVAEYPQCGEAWFIKGQTHAALGQNGLATRAFRESEKANDFNPGIPFERAELALQKGNVESAVELMEQGISLLFADFSSLQVVAEAAEESDSLSSALGQALKSYFAKHSITKAEETKLKRSLTKVCKQYIKREPS